MSALLRSIFGPAQDFPSLMHVVKEFGRRQLHLLLLLPHMGLRRAYRLEHRHLLLHQVEFRQFR